ncbi:MAG: 2-oxoglutarate dehydrogenase complex dihydrolipoyllysine-residue succinyltransferase [Chloroflexaceae bacterium]|nr:2-oxoglutarate dehydrogenase complex dihydrolipoyllysine-residue succinyltransferase [Chloroflexaceae bacterium]
MAMEVRVPALGESIVEATISKWLKREGEAVGLGEPIVELETDKVNLEVAAEQAGVLVAIIKAEGETVAIDDLIATIDGNGGATYPAPAAPVAAAPANGPAASPPPIEATPAVPTPPDPVEVAATPTALKVAAENNLDINAVAGTGPGGRVTKEDVITHMLRLAQATAPAPVAIPAPAAPPAPLTTDSGQPLPTGPMPTIVEIERREERQRMSRRRQTIARRLVEAQATAAMLTTFNEADMLPIMTLRKKHKESFKERHGVGLGFMSFFTKAVVSALKAFPLLNAEIDGDDVVLKHYYDIGVAVGTEQGLVVPVLRDADRKGFAEIERGILELANRARDSKLTLAELQGGTFSITNGGVYGSLMSTPILNTPQVGILGMHKIMERPIVINGEIVVRPMMYLALTYDHRIVDGSEAVRFLVHIKSLLEDPEALLLAS